ncbi:MAG: phosphohydrolase, partial [Actinobacteria bacterium]|nr:phosphohydrolase [Actinomycetota bacterium]
ELAREHSLPQEVIDIIRQHHGTSLVSYFYSKAAEGNTPVYEADFRYDGDAPHSREAALVMLADCAEASVRALRKPTAIRVENAVRRVIENKVADGQLTNSTLTLADIESVIQVYTKVLKAINHSRVEYYEPLTVRSEYADKSRESSRA